MKKKIWASILCVFMIFCTVFVFVGCPLGNSPSENDSEISSDEDLGDDDLEDGETNPDDMVISMYGTKVLYRPDSYDYMGNASSEQGTINDYYKNYATILMTNIYGMYGVVDSTIVDKYLDGFETNLPYFYDSIRYNLNAVYNLEDGTIALVANSKQRWKWTFDYKYTPVSPLVETAGLYKIDGNVITSWDWTSMDVYTSLFTTPYQDTLSTYTTALEYVVYSYALDLEPEAMQVNPGNATTAYSITIGGKDVNTALAEVKEKFNANGMYVGLLDRQQNKISNWILANVIGDDAMANDVVKIYDGVKKNDDNTFDLTGATVKQTISNPRQYEKAIPAIVEGVCKNVQIGKDLTIDNPFIASEIIEYSQNIFFIAGDENFPVPGTSSVSAIKPLEYQSVAIMFNEETHVDSISVALKYDAGLDGNLEDEKGNWIWDENNYLDIIVDLNFYDYETDTYVVLQSEEMRVLDGAYEFGEHNDYTVTFEMFTYKDKQGNSLDKKKLIENGILTKDEAVIVNTFNTDIAEGMLKTIPSYSIPAVTSDKNKLILVGYNNVRNYYELVESTEQENLAGKSYSTGRFNSDAFKKDPNGCDYLEITYKVVKDPADANKIGANKKNYKFYTGITSIMDSGY